MKKIITLILGISLIFLVTGCLGNDNSVEVNEEMDEETIALETDDLKDYIGKDIEELMEKVPDMIEDDRVFSSDDVKAAIDENRDVIEISLVKGSYNLYGIAPGLSADNALEILETLNHEYTTDGDVHSAIIRRNNTTLSFTNNEGTIEDIILRKN